MGRPRGLSEISQRKTILYDFTYMCNRNKTKQKNPKQNLYREPIGGCQRRGLGKMGKWAKRHKLLVIKYISHGDAVCSMATIVNNTVFHI